ncbi:MAG: GlsB/YeaQ/YmgE family stress response membrane protein [Oceanicaulis sp.]
MTLETLLIWLFVGAVAGWLAGQVVRGYGLGLIGNIVVGIIGAFVGGWVFGQLGIAISQGIVGSIIGATVGAIVILFLLQLVRRR